MRIKSYYSGSVEAAMSMARRELGEEAMLVQSRRTSPDNRQYGEYEVVFADVEGTDSPAVPVQQAAAAAAAATAVAPAPVLGELAVLRTQIDELRRSVTRSASNYPAWLPPTSPLAERYSALIGQDLEAPLAQQIVLNVHTRLTRPATRGAEADRGDLDAMLRAEIEKLMVTDSGMPAGKSGPPVIAMVGPPGAGKTATLAKLAVRYGLGEGRTTQILSVDTYRVGSAEQLRVYSGLLGVAFRAVESVRELGQALEECRNKQLILIDTPGYGFGDFDYASELAAFFADHDEIQTHLMLPASMKPLDMARVVNRFDAFCPSRLIFSRLDETASYGPLLGMAVVTGKPVSFLTAGQRIPEDLAAASAGRLAEMILPQRQATSVLSAA